MLFARRDAHQPMTVAEVVVRSSNYQRAVSDGLGNARVLFRAREERRRAHSGTCLAKGYMVGVHYSQPGKPEITHGASGSAYVEFDGLRVVLAATRNPL
jgi:hypothetical protein